MAHQSGIVIARMIWNNVALQSHNGCVSTNFLFSLYLSMRHESSKADLAPNDPCPV